MPDDLTTICDVCGEAVAMDDATTCDLCGQTLCDDCVCDCEGGCGDPDQWWEA